MTTLLDRTGDTWVQPDVSVDSWEISGSDYRMEWRRREIELAWGPVTEVQK